MSDTYSIIQLYLGDEVWVNLTGLIYHGLKFACRSQRDSFGVVLLLYKVQQRLDFLTSEVQHWVQVINYTVFKLTQTKIRSG